MDKTKKKHKSVGERLAYAYIRKIKKWMFCPNCQNGKMGIDKKSTVWICEECGYKLSADEFEDDYVFWFCDECNSYLNNQEGFDRQSKKHICQNCGYENDTTFDNIKGICSDCGKIIPAPDATLCVDCKINRKEKAKERLISAGKVVATVAAVAGTVYLAAQASDDETEYLPLPDEKNDEGEDEMSNYPTCKTCGATMTEFDGWAWYTCPECGDEVRIIDGTVTWYNEIFGRGKKEHRSDFELADFCRGGDLTED